MIGCIHMRELNMSSEVMLVRMPGRMAVSQSQPPSNLCCWALNFVPSVLSLLCHSLQRQQNSYFLVVISFTVTDSVFLCSVLIMKINIETYLDAFTKALWE